MNDKYLDIATDQERLKRTARNSIQTLSSLYADRTHFILELLQNAEDALRKRQIGWHGSRAVKFDLTDQCLRVVHNGKPFDHADVQAICSVGETTKELTDIGRFGIGFKSVYAFTDCPHIHSGLEDFAIEDYILPTGIQSIERNLEETIILIPRKPADAGFMQEIQAGLKRLGPSTLLFLREIEEIEWAVEDGTSGLYIRSKPIALGNGARRITVLGQAKGESDIEETWLVFEKPAITVDGVQAGNVEIAFLLVKDAKSNREKIKPISKSPLVVFFPTSLETYLGFLVQGPYRTTPSRENVPKTDTWNQYCAKVTESVLIDALYWMREHNLLDTDALRCLPMDASKFTKDMLFSSLFSATKQALINEQLLPRHVDGYVAGRQASLARTQDLRELLSPAQLTALLGEDTERIWLSGDISQDRTPELRNYVLNELGVSELRPDTLLPRFNAAFMERQSNEWVSSLYEFLNGQKALLQRTIELPLVRLTNGKHVRARANGQPQVFLPGTFKSDFPTVHPEVCSRKEAKEFLMSLGLTAPDPVDDVVWNILPKYRANDVDVDDEMYEADIQRILAAFTTDSKTQREKLISALRETSFLMVVDTGNGKVYVAEPGSVYLSTDRLKELFSGISDVLRVDDKYTCLRGAEVRELLEACGAVRYLRPVEDTSLTRESRGKLREQAGHSITSGYNDRVTDWTLSGLHNLLKEMPSLDYDVRCRKASLLWEELANLEERRGKGIFVGEYTWTHYGSYRSSFDAAFVRMLNESEWVPDGTGNFQRPEMVTFESLGWKPYPFLQTKILFKPPIIDRLAREAGFEPGVLDLLKKLGVTSEAELKTRLGIKDDEESSRDESSEENLSPEEALRKLGIPPATPPASVINEPSQTSKEDGTKVGQPAGHAGGSSAARHQASGANHTGTTSHGGHRQSAGTSSGTSRPFISYIGVHNDDHESDPDGLTQEARIALEERAIEVILQKEPQLSRTPTNNPGFDLIETNSVNMPLRWIEVKAMSKDLYSRPVGMSRTQFDCAREHGIHYWLYVVEHADDHARARIVKIQDPAGKACTFTFDHGWQSVAEMDERQTPSEKDTGEENED